MVQRELVEKKRWLTREQFVEDWAVAQIMPRPNVVNLSMMIGDRCFGLSGALAALAGMLTVPTVVVRAAGCALQQRGRRRLRATLRGMGAVAAGLILGTGIKLIGALRANAMGMPACIGLALATFVAIACCGCRWARAAGAGRRRLRLGLEAAAMNRPSPWARPTG